LFVKIAVILGSLVQLIELKFLGLQLFKRNCKHCWNLSDLHPLKKDQCF